MTKAAELAKMGEVLTNSQIGGRRNMIINGAMQVAQRGTSGTSANSISYYTVDRFNFRGQSTGVYTIEQSTDAPSNFKNSTKITVTTPDTSIGGGERYWMASYLEGNSISHLNFGSSNAETVTLSFYIKSSLTGTFSGGLVNSAFDRAYAFTYVISSANTWERKTITIEGDTSGTWLTTNDIGISVVWDLGAATNRQQSSGAWTASGSVAATGASQVIATNNATWQITGIQLEVGSQATPFEHRSYGEELALCQRYYQIIPKYTFFTGAVEVGTASLRAGVPLARALRASPTIGNITLAIYDDDDTSFSNAAHAIFANSGSPEVDGTTGYLSVIFNGNLSGRTDNHNVTALYGTNGTLDSEL